MILNFILYIKIRYFEIYIYILSCITSFFNKKYYKNLAFSKKISFIIIYLLLYFALIYQIVKL